MPSGTEHIGQLAPEFEGLTADELAEYEAESMLRPGEDETKHRERAAQLAADTKRVAAERREQAASAGAAEHNDEQTGA